MPHALLVPLRLRNGDWGHIHGPLIDPKGPFRTSTAYTGTAVGLQSTALCALICTARVSSQIKNDSSSLAVLDPPAIQWETNCPFVRTRHSTPDLGIG